MTLCAIICFHLLSFQSHIFLIFSDISQESSGSEDQILAFKNHRLPAGKRVQKKHGVFQPILIFTLQLKYNAFTGGLLKVHNFCYTMIIFKGKFPGHADEKPRKEEETSMSETC